MASILRTASLVLSLSTILMISGCCNGRPQPPEYTSFFTSPTSIRVEWEPPTMDEGATVKGFRLQYKLGEKGKLIKLKLNVEYSHDIEGLDEPCGDYLIRMSIATSSGLSRYTSFSTVDRVHSAPQNLNSVPSGSSARVTWSTPENGFCVTGYQLKYGPNENELQSMQLPIELNQYLLSDLQPGTSYLMTLASIADEEVSEEAYVQWYQAAVPPAPSNLQANPSSTETVVVIWSPTSSGITRYEYLYGPAGTPDFKLTSGYVEAGTTILELDGLRSGREYVIKVTSVNSVGQSSAAVVTWTQPAPDPEVRPSKPVPTAPGQVTVQITSAETAQVSWTPPEGDIEITGYIVGFGLRGTENRDLSLFSMPPDEPLENELDGLKPGSTYVVNIQAYNDVGDGEIRSTEWQQVAPEVPISVPTEVRGVLTYSSSPTTIVVRWLISEDVATEQTDGFRVTYGSNPQANEFREEVDAEVDSLELQDLKADSFYYLKVYKFNAAGVSHAVSRSLQTLTPPPEEGCAQQQKCVRQFESRPQGDGEVCPGIVQYVNCLQWLRDVCMEDANYRSRVASVRELFLTEGCNRRNGNGGQDPPVPGGFDARPVEPILRGGFDARPVEPILREIIPPPTNLEASVLSPTSARLSWIDESLGDSQVVTDGRFYTIQYRSPLDQDYLEVRTQETSYVADFLIPGVQYEFNVQLVLDPKRRSERSTSVTVTSRDPAQGTRVERFTVTQISVSRSRSANAVLNWLPPPDRQNVMEYRVEYTDAEEYRDPATIWQRVIVDGSQLSTIIKGLRPDQEYHIRITALFSPTESGPTLASPGVFTTPVIPPSSKAGKRCGETELQAVTRRVSFLWDEVADGAQRPPLYGIPIPFCEDEFGVEECHGIFCFCIPGKRPAALRDPECTADVPPCRREYNAARIALDEARQTGTPATAAQLPHCREDGYYHPKQCSGTMCYCVTENGAHTGRESPIWEASRLNCV